MVGESGSFCGDLLLTAHVRFEAAVDEKVVGGLPSEMPLSDEMGRISTGRHLLREQCELERGEVGVGAGLEPGNVDREPNVVWGSIRQWRQGRTVENMTPQCAAY